MTTTRGVADAMGTYDIRPHFFLGHAGDTAEKTDSHGRKNRNFEGFYRNMRFV
jgi:hypothetical protein